MLKVFKSFVWWLISKVFPKHKCERLVNEPGNEMWRVGRGFNNFRPFFRIDWGNRAWRWTIPVDYYKDFWDRLYPSLTPLGQQRCDELIANLTLEGHDEPTLHGHVNVVRTGGVVLRERKDLWPKLWVKATELTRDRPI